MSCSDYLFPPLSPMTLRLPYLGNCSSSPPSKNKISSQFPFSCLRALANGRTSVSAMESSSKLWGGDGRFGCGMNVDLSRLNDSLSTDKRLYAEDICGSLAYARILLDAKIIRADELRAIESGFEVVRREWESGTLVLRDGDEDVHSVNERRLSELVGDVGRKLHTGRSRNDQVAVDMKLWMKKAIAELLVDVKCLLRAMVVKAREEIHVIMPGYTHLQVKQAARRSLK